MASNNMTLREALLAEAYEADIDRLEEEVDRLRGVLKVIGETSLDFPATAGLGYQLHIAMQAANRMRHIARGALE